MPNQKQEMDVIQPGTSAESIPKDLLMKMKQFRSMENRQTKEDNEVEHCMKDTDSYPPSPRSSVSDDVFFRFPKRSIENDDVDDKRSQNESRDTKLPSPGPDRNNSIYGDNSDWMLAERVKPRSPPVSPNGTAYYHGNIFSPISEKKMTLERTSVKALHCQPLFSQNIDPTLNGSPLKLSPVPIRNSEYGLQASLHDRTPIKMHQDRISPRRSPMLSAMTEGHYRGNKSPLPYARDPTVDPRGSEISPEYHRALYMEDLAKRGARKQLSFDVGSRPYMCPEPEGYSDILYSPRRNRYRANSDSDVMNAEERFDDEDSRLIKKFLSHLNKRKRKASDRFDSDYEEDAAINARKKRKELEKKMNMNYLKQLEADVSILNNKLKRAEPELRPDNCTCAVMEKQFLNMAENAYKNIRRQDMTAEGFAQFRKELNDTNGILRESLELVQNLKEFCEHRQMLSRN